MTKELRVYLDRQIPHDNLLYKSSSEKITHDAPQELPPKLQLMELFGEDAKDDLLRKPDFQRATSAWTPEECVSLLHSVLNEQVIPSIIMWRSPENHWYVLDRGHRLSVVLAWIRDDWGDTLASEELSNTRFNKQEFKGELSRQERYDREKEELLQDSFDLHQQVQAIRHDVPSKDTLVCPHLKNFTSYASDRFV
jgi:Protein of unknown function DUF262